MIELTFQEIKDSTAEFLTPEEIAETIGCKPYSINVQANADPSKLGFPVSIIGTRVRIPRLGFLHWVQFGNSPVITGSGNSAN